MWSHSRHTFAALEREAREYVVGYTENDAEAVLGLRDAPVGLGFVTPDYATRYDVVRTEPLDLNLPGHMPFIAQIDRLKQRDPELAQREREEGAREKAEQEALKEQRKLDRERQDEALKLAQEEKERHIATVAERLTQYQQAMVSRYRHAAVFLRGAVVTFLLFLFPLLWWPVTAFVFRQADQRYSGMAYEPLLHEFMALVHYAPGLTLVYGLLFWFTASQRRISPSAFRSMRSRSWLSGIPMLLLLLTVLFQLTALCSAVMLGAFDMVALPLAFWKRIAAGVWSLQLSEPICVAFAVTLIYGYVFSRVYRSTPFYLRAPDNSLPGAFILVLMGGFFVIQEHALSINSELASVLQRAFAGLVLAILALGVDYLMFKKERKRNKVIELPDMEREEATSLSRLYVNQEGSREVLEAFMRKKLMFNGIFHAALKAADTSENSRAAQEKILGQLGVRS